VIVWEKASVITVAILYMAVEHNTTKEDTVQHPTTLHVAYITDRTNLHRDIGIYRITHCKIVRECCKLVMTTQVNRKA